MLMRIHCAQLTVYARCGPHRSWGGWGCGKIQMGPSRYEVASQSNVSNPLICGPQA